MFPEAPTPAARRAFVQRAVATLAPKLRDLALRRKEYGVDCRDTRRLALAHGLASGGEDGRSLSWFALVPRAASLRAHGVRDEYTPTGNRPTVYLHPEYAP